MAQWTWSRPTPALPLVLLLAACIGTTESSRPDASGGNALDAGSQAGARDALAPPADGGADTATPIDLAHPRDSTPDAAGPDVQATDAQLGDVELPDARTMEAGAPDLRTPDLGAGHDASAPTDGSPPPDAGPLVLDWPEQRVGIFYLTWHAYAAKAMQRIPEGERRTVEEVIQDPDAAFGDLIADRGLMATAKAFHYHLRPEAGFYCLYRPRPGEPPYPESEAGPDCGDVGALAARHARQLWEAGVDFVYVDLTNLPAFSPFADVLGLRPLEVLLEEWAALRRAGTPTPQIAAWLPARAVGAEQTAMLHRVLDVYDTWRGRDLLLRHGPTAEPVVFVVAGADVDPALMDEARRRGVLPVRLWGNLSAERLAAGDAGWMQPCTQEGAFTTLISPEVPCQQGYTRTSPLGTVLSVSLSYQIGYASLPLQSSGRNEGLTLQKQFETAFAVQPDYLLINAFNELIAQPQANPHPEALGSLRRSMGVGAADGDALADSLWVDMYGVEFNRDLEPSVQGGDAAYQLMTSCVRVYRTGSPACEDPAEPCCQLQPGLRLVYSLRLRNSGTWGGDHVPTVDPRERQALLDGGAFEEVGNPFFGPPGLPGGATTADGAFHLYAAPGPGRAALHRCHTGVDHFLSADPACEGHTPEGRLGWLHTRRSSAAPRPLRRCYAPERGVHFHWLAERCPSDPGVREEAVLGFVR